MKAFCQRRPGGVFALATLLIPLACAAVIDSGGGPSDVGVYRVHVSIGEPIATGATTAGEHGGAFPDTAEALRSLPGIGPYTSAAIAAIAFDRPEVVLDGAGVVFAIDTSTWEIAWQFATRGGAGNCNNVAAPAVAGKFLHVGTTAGYYYVLDRDQNTAHFSAITADRRSTGPPDLVAESTRDHHE